ncbi:MFS transporter [Streptomyces sp. NPDC007851]|uniref:MFS transporter n=1 Tax=Streptomyces sp. NPDC007851 TaxID=3155008 RepID=UPI0033F4D47D
MVVLDFSIVNVALSSIQRELDVSAAAVQWVVTACAIAFGGMLILGGRAGDLYGRRRLFLAGIGVFTAASLAGGLARDPGLLIAARLVQGSGAAMVAPAALSLITTGFAEGPRRTRALGLYGATASVGFVAGQVLGGVLVELLSWRSVFLGQRAGGAGRPTARSPCPAAVETDACRAAPGPDRRAPDHPGGGRPGLRRLPRRPL